ncbi:MAG TPA: hypothetical protein PKA00_18255 [Saprospiraceae bacterium]|nr:hypothetical protein [Saprospiraceae bacterium]HMQ84862.1 hypothetical protein [Saprospiraceae bacterium]
MAAYYHILTPLEISIQDEPTLVSKFDEMYGNDFKFKSSKRVERFSPPLLNGKRLDFSFDQKTYAMDENIIRMEFLDFCKVFFDEWKSLYSAKFKGIFPAYLPSEFELESIVVKVKRLLDSHPLVSDELEKGLKKLDENYHFSIECIAPQYVYQGYPLKTDHHTHLFALDFLHAYEKMGVHPEEHTAMFMLVDKIKEKYSNQFIIAKYLFLAGY